MADGCSKFSHHKSRLLQGHRHIVIISWTISHVVGVSVLVYEPAIYISQESSRRNEAAGYPFLKTVPDGDAVRQSCYHIPCFNTNVFPVHSTDVSLFSNIAASEVFCRYTNTILYRICSMFLCCLSAIVRPPAKFVGCSFIQIWQQSHCDGFVVHGRAPVSI